VTSPSSQLDVPDTTFSNASANIIGNQVDTSEASGVTIVYSTSGAIGGIIVCVFITCVRRRRRLNKDRKSLLEAQAQRTRAPLRPDASNRRIVVAQEENDTDADGSTPREQRDRDVDEMLTPRSKATLSAQSNQPQVSDLRAALLHRQSPHSTPATLPADGDRSYRQVADAASTDTSIHPSQFASDGGQLIHDMRHDLLHIQQEYNDGLLDPRQEDTTHGDEFIDDGLSDFGGSHNSSQSSISAPPVPRGACTVADIETVADQYTLNTVYAAGAIPNPMYLGDHEDQLTSPNSSEGSHRSRNSKRTSLRNELPTAPPAPARLPSPSRMSMAKAFMHKPTGPPSVIVEENESDQSSSTSLQSSNGSQANQRLLSTQDPDRRTSQYV